MIVAEQLIGFYLPWERTVYENLKNISVFHTYVSGKTLWVFRLKDLELVEKILAQPVILGGEEIEQVETEKEKGESGYDLFHYPKIYQLRYWKKNKYGIPVQRRENIPKVTVMLLWGIMCKFPMGHVVKSEVVWKNIAESQNLERYFRKTGSFDEEKFFGTRMEYLRRFNWPMKVLDLIGQVEYHKCGEVVRLREAFVEPPLCEAELLG